MLAITQISSGFSRLCAIYLLLMHGLPMLFLWVVLHTDWRFYICSILSLLSLVFFSAKHLFLLLPTAIVQLWHESDGHWLLLLKNGKVISAGLLGDSFITRYLIILNFKSTHTKKTYSVLFWPDNLSAENFRKLRVVLLAGRMHREE